MEDSVNAPKDVVVIGAGIVGLATAYRLIERYGSRVTVLEKEPGPARHQSGRNSGVLHSGIYYKPGSLKSQLCRAGKAEMEAFCKRENIKYEICGKVIVATDEPERMRLERLVERGQANGVACELIDAKRLHELEPAVTGVAGAHVPGTGIVDYVQVCKRLSAIIEDRGGRVVCNAEAQRIQIKRNSVAIHTPAGVFEGEMLINCAGLYADAVTRLCGIDPGIRMIPFRGEYFALTPDAHHLCRNLIYPVPDPTLPFLGVHLTRMVAGGVECGPNAVPALAREGYSWGKVDPKHVSSTLLDRAFWKMSRKYLKTGMSETFRSFSRHAFLHSLQRLVPDVKLDQLVKAPAGVRAQVLTKNGSLLDDFAIARSERAIHVCNAPSPAATASLAIADYIVDQAVAAAESAA